MTKKEIILLVVIALIAAGGSLWYVKYILPKQEAAKELSPQVVDQDVTVLEFEKKIPDGLPLQYAMSNSGSAEMEIIGSQKFEDTGGIHRYFIFETDKDLETVKKYYTDLYQQEGWDVKKISEGELSRLEKGQIRMRAFKDSDILVVDLFNLGDSKTRVIIRHVSSV